MILSTKTLAGSFSYYRDASQSNPVSYMYAHDLNGDGEDEVILVAFETQPNTPAQYSNTSVHLFGWHQGIFQEVTSQWLPGNSSEVEGVGDVAFGDFNGDGLEDVFLSGYTDMEHPANAYVLYNTGNGLRKVPLGLQTWMHSVRSHDINADGYDDIIPTGYADMPRYLGSANGLVKQTGFTGGSGLALGDFMNNGLTSVIFVDAGWRLNDTYLYAFDFATPGAINAVPISQLPGPRLESIAPTASSHDIRAIPYDFSDDGLLDVIVLGYGFGLDETASHRSEVQFLQNRGNGVFEDVTDTYRIGYDVSGNVGYTPQLLDVNQDGRLDLFMSMPDWLPRYNSTTLLLQQQDGSFVDSARELLNTNIESGGGQGLIVQGPDHINYLVSEGAWNYNHPVTQISIQRIDFPERQLPEQLSGTRQDDTLRGIGGDDALHGGLGNDTLDGGSGNDTALYTSDISQYSLRIDRAHHAVTVFDRQADRDGNDTLLNIERLRFDSQTFDLLNPALAGAPKHSIDNSFLFDAAYYLLSNPQLVPSVNMDTAFMHYLSTGAAQGMAPNAWFDPVYYANRWDDLRPLNLSADILFQHYNLFGVWEGRVAGLAYDKYDGNRYLSDNPDVAAYVDANVEDFLGSRTNGAVAHFLIYGANEGRVAYDIEGTQIEQIITVGVAQADTWQIT